MLTLFLKRLQRNEHSQNIHRLAWKQRRWPGILFFAAGLMVMGPGCAADGPPLKHIPVGQPATLSGHYHFTPGLPLFASHQFGEIYIKPFRKQGTGQIKYTRFKMRILGQLPDDGSVRIRSYEGLAFQQGDRLQLRSERCYLFGKAYWEDRLRPLERWDCHHLAFEFRSPSNFRDRDSLQPVQSKLTRHSDWFKSSHLIPRPNQKAAIYAGHVIDRKLLVEQSLEVQSNDKIHTRALDKNIESQMPATQLILWGTGGHNLLHKQQVLNVYDSNNKQVGSLQVLSRPGETVLARWIKKPAQVDRSLYAISNERRASDFDFF